MRNRIRPAMREWWRYLLIGSLAALMISAAADASSQFGIAQFTGTCALFCATAGAIAGLWNTRTSTNSRP